METCGLSTKCAGIVAERGLHCAAEYHLELADRIAGRPHCESGSRCISMNTSARLQGIGGRFPGPTWRKPTDSYK